MQEGLHEIAGALVGQSGAMRTVHRKEMLSGGVMRIKGKDSLQGVNRVKANQKGC